MRPLPLVIVTLFALAIEVPPAAAAPRGYVCGPNGCYPVASATAAKCASGSCGVARVGFLRRLFNR
jgi:uncharacterized membrane protein